MCRWFKSSWGSKAGGRKCPPFLFMMNMIQLGRTLISTELLSQRFVCDLQACKGECCVQGDAGAPLEEDELPVLEKIYPQVRPFMRPEGIRAVEQQGLYVKDRDGDWTTPLINGAECAFVVFDNNRIALCAIEMAWRAGRIDFPKPVSCHLYPVRLTEYTDFTAVNVHHWDICSPACALGEKMNMPLYRFLEEPLTRKFGSDWYAELEEVAREWEQNQR